MASRFRALTKGMGVRMVEKVAGTMRSVGKSMDQMGANMEVAKYTEKLVPSTRFVAVDGVVPTLSSPGTFVAPTASVIGDVTIGKDSSVWYGAKVRGDSSSITIGRRSHIMDRAVIACDSPTTIGNNVTIGAGATVNSCTLQDGCLIGEGALILDDVIIESNAMVEPGAVVNAKTTVKAGEVWAGSPAHKVRDLSSDEITKMVEATHETSQLASMHLIETEKDYIEVKQEEELAEYLEGIDEMYIDRRDSDSKHEVLGQGLPGRIFNSTLTHPEEGLDLSMKLKYGDENKQEQK